MWLMHAIPVLMKLRQEDCHEFRDILGYIVSSTPIWSTK